MLYHDKPKNKGVENGLKRAKQMVDFEWSPLKIIPNVMFYTDPEGKKHYINSFVKPGLPQKGVTYSSARIVDKHVGFEVALDTYATALMNPDSVLYTRNLHGTSGHGVGCYYGIVCSAFASYVHDLPYQVVCKDWPKYPGVKLLDIDERWPEAADELELLDIVLDVKSHIAVITDIERDVDGHVVTIEVSEATLPLTKATSFTLDEFKLYWFGYGFKIYRKSDLENITYTPCAYSPVEGDEDDIDEDNVCEMMAAEYAPSFMTDYGDKANYALGEPVVFSVFDEAIREIEVFDDKDKKTKVKVKDGKASFRPKAAGIYFATAVNQYGEEESVSWYTFDCAVSADKKVYAVGEPIRFSFRDAQNHDKCDLIYVKNQERYKKYIAHLTAEDLEKGETVLPGLSEPGEYYIVVYSVSPYARYGSVEIRIEVK